MWRRFSSIAAVDRPRFDRPGAPLRGGGAPSFDWAARQLPICQQTHWLRPRAGAARAQPQPEGRRRLATGQRGARRVASSANADVPSGPPRAWRAGAPAALGNAGPVHYPSAQRPVDIIIGRDFFCPGGFGALRDSWTGQRARRSRDTKPLGAVPFTSGLEGTHSLHCRVLVNDYMRSSGCPGDLRGSRILSPRTAPRPRTQTGSAIARTQSDVLTRAAPASAILFPEKPGGHRWLTFSPAEIRLSGVEGACVGGGPVPPQSRAWPQSV